MTAHLGYPIPSPAIFDKIGAAFRRAVARFSEDEHIPVVRFTKADRKIDKMRPYIAAQAKTGRSGVAAIGIAQEYANVFTGTQREGSTGAPWLRRNGLIARDTGRNLYRLTDDGLAFAIFYTKVHNRVLRPLMATDRPQAPPPLRAAMRTIDVHIDARLAQARLPTAAA